MQTCSKFCSNRRELRKITQNDFIPIVDGTFWYFPLELEISFLRRPIVTFDVEFFSINNIFLKCSFPGQNGKFNEINQKLHFFLKIRNDTSIFLIKFIPMHFFYQETYIEIWYRRFLQLASLSQKCILWEILTKFENSIKFPPKNGARIKIKYNI